MAAGRLDAGGEVRGGLQEPDLARAATAMASGFTASPMARSKLWYESVRSPVGDPDGDDLARLIGGHEQGDAELAQQRRQRVRVLVADFARGRGAVTFRQRGAGVGDLARGLDLHQ